MDELPRGVVHPGPDADAGAEVEDEVVQATAVEVTRDHGDRAEAVQLYRTRPARFGAS
jgi:hypothetical protein